MNRLYDEDGMRKAFGWSRGAYADSVPGRPMPNIAVVCRATVQLAKRRVRAWVVNLVGVAHDSRSQPDYKVFTTREQVLAAYRRIWQLGVAAALMLRKEHGVDVLQVYNVGGGAFSGSLFDDFVRECFEPAFLPLLPRLEQAGVRVAGYDVRARRFDGGWIPNVLEDMDNGALARMLWVNAWDPWSLIGNGNARDASLDGFGGRCSNLAVLGWPRTNPHLKYVVAVSGEGEDGHEAHKQEL
ncbi:hypothetical protein DFJ74DRAFT_680868 [Hyaloraphidium curvatum]|nr:hypothetical protein DFJ74DRAFT_680868 [Hyaloraphidium curvatum]